ncbi:leucine-rich repeat domain-containing protein [Catellatospora aurea]|uniref:Leucine-rich repeat domain-containing protein n=1 Tax=Catellatospora aurea TaxID=1337874 RepID=A0ABW2HB20_9ACTN
MRGRFKDHDLWIAVRQAVGEVTEQSLRELTELDWSEYRAEAGEYWAAIYDLAGLELCESLRRLSLDGNGVKSLRPLSGLARLEELWLVQNQVTDVRPLAGLPRLRVLALAMNPRLKSVAALAGSASLEDLDLTGTAVTNLSPLLEVGSLRRLDWRPPSATSEPLLRRADRVIAELTARGVAVHQ